MKKAKIIERKQERSCQIQIRQPTLLIAIPPAKTVINENSHSPKALDAFPM